MCGIVGMVSKTHVGISKQAEDTFMQLLYANALRGDDSTGLICVEKDSSFHIMKQATEAAWFGPQYKNSDVYKNCLLYTSPSPRDYAASRMPSSA